MTNKIKASNITDGTITTDKIAPGTIASDRIAPGTIAADRLAGGITNSQLAGSIANAKLANQAITINGTSIDLGASGTITAGTDWQAVKTADFSAVAGEGYIVNTAGGGVTVTPPGSPSAGDEVAIVQSGSNAVTIARNGNNIESGTNNITMANANAVSLVYSGNATIGWVRSNNDTPEAFVSATGGTETTSGSYKIHTFNVH